MQTKIASLALTCSLLLTACGGQNLVRVETRAPDIAAERFELPPKPMLRGEPRAVSWIDLFVLAEERGAWGDQCRLQLESVGADLEEVRKAAKQRV